MEGIALILVMLIAIIGPAAVIVFLIGMVAKSLKRNPAAATKVTVGMVGLMLLVVAISVLSMLVLFRLFNK